MPPIGSSARCFVLPGPCVNFKDFNFPFDPEILLYLLTRSFSCGCAKPVAVNKALLMLFDTVTT